MNSPDEYQPPAPYQPAEIPDPFDSPVASEDEDSNWDDDGDTSDDDRVPLWQTGDSAEEPVGENNTEESLGVPLPTLTLHSPAEPPTVEETPEEPPEEPVNETVEEIEETQAESVVEIIDQLMDATEEETDSTPAIGVEEISVSVTEIPPIPEQLELVARVEDLKRQEAQLQQAISALQSELAETQLALGQVVKDALADLEQRKQTLQIAVEQLERRRERIRDEMRKTFAGTSQELAIRVQGFKDYLVGSLQDLAAAAEQLELQKAAESAPPPKPVVEEARLNRPQPTPSADSNTPRFAENTYQANAKQIRGLLDQYRSRPDYYGPPWQLRRTFEPVHAERVANWFFSQGGRGAIRTMGSRLQNILIASAVISVLSTLYGDRARALILANSPERLGEWRRGLQDCLGISRGDFGPNRGVVLFEEAEALSLKADRLVKDGELPLIIVDDTENQISLSLLQFPLLLAFAPDPQQMAMDYRY